MGLGLLPGRLPLPPLPPRRPPALFPRLPTGLLLGLLLNPLLEPPPGLPPGPAPFLDVPGLGLLALPPTATLETPLVPGLGLPPVLLRLIGDLPLIGDLMPPAVTGVFLAEPLYGRIRLCLTVGGVPSELDERIELLLGLGIEKPTGLVIGPFTGDFFLLPGFLDRLLDLRGL